MLMVAVVAVGDCDGRGVAGGDFPRTEVGHSFNGFPGFSATHASTSAVALAIVLALRMTSGSAETRSFSMKTDRGVRVRVGVTVRVSVGVRA